jgi:hypothetical protein
VPYRTNEYTPAGGLMGEYLPVVDYPTAASLPSGRGPAGAGGFLRRLSGWRSRQSCRPAEWSFSADRSYRGDHAMRRAGLQPGGCAAPAAHEHHRRRLWGFPEWPSLHGEFELSRITDTTQNWSAGYSGDTCTVSISGWDNDLIELVANVNQNGLCPLAAGDQLTVNVWNPSRWLPRRSQSQLRRRN